MTWRGLYAILDIGPHLAPEEALLVARAWLDGGASIIQLRAKHMDAGPYASLAAALARETRARRVPFIVNDRLDIAEAVGAEGVHLGQDDLPAARFRPRYGGLIGLSCHSPADVEAARAARADNIGYGPVFRTITKANPDPVVGLDGLEHAVRLAGPMPVVAIGGVTLEALPDIRKTGCNMVAAISALHTEPEATARAFAEALA